MLTPEQENALLAVAMADPEYQQLNEEYIHAEAAFTRILEGLSKNDQLVLQYYASRCREREYRKTSLAYQLGRMTGG